MSGKKAHLDLKSIRLTGFLPVRPFRQDSWPIQDIKFINKMSRINSNTVDSGNSELGFVTNFVH